MKTLFPDDNIDNDSQIHKNIRSNAQKAYEKTDDLLFSENEITFVINGENSKKAPGIDGITADIVQRLHSIDNQFLTMVYNKCLTCGLFPKIWKNVVSKC